MKRSIQIALNSDSVQKAIDALEEEKKRIKALMRVLCVRLAEEGAAAARGVYGPQVEVTVENTDNGARIIASGEEVVFLEFGTGIYTDASHPLAGNADRQDVYVYPGSWSEEHKKQFVTYGYWYHDGERIEGEQPLYAMWSADQQIAAQMARIAKEVFNK